MKNKTCISGFIILLLRLYALSVGAFTFFRIILFLLYAGKITGEYYELGTIAHAFLNGLRFDIVITGYIVLVPFLFLSVEKLVFCRKIIWLRKFVFYYLLLFYSLAFFISAADLPYFGYFFRRLDAEVFTWFDSPGFMFKMIVEEPAYISAILPFIVVEVLFVKLLSKIILKDDGDFINDAPAKRIIVFVVLSGLIFLGIRGRVAKKSPIRIGTAYFCEDQFLNKLGLNPVFTFMRTTLDYFDSRNKPVSLMDEKLAMQNVKRYLCIKRELSPNAPLARINKFDGIPVKRMWL